MDATGTSSGDLEGCVFPKPVKRVKVPKPLRRGRRRRPRAEQPPQKFSKPVRPEKMTAHGRRERGMGKMAFLSTMRCLVMEAFWDTFTNEDVAAAGSPCIPPPCRSRWIQVMHLRAEASQHRPTEQRVAPGCVDHHQDIDGRTGGRGTWYVALGRINQRRLRDTLSELGEAYWMQLTAEERADWDARAAARPQARRV